MGVARPPLEYLAGQRWRRARQPAATPRANRTDRTSPPHQTMTVTLDFARMMALPKTEHPASQRDSALRGRFERAETMSAFTDCPASALRPF